MVDYTFTLGLEMFRAIEGERALERERGRWLAELRAAARRDRKPKATRPIVATRHQRPGRLPEALDARRASR